ncbi:MAG: hypothetical protein NC123_14450 [Butyrivibrio sp.]|nr:hypothetical protein [Butyrivibrio sp.]
MSLTKEKNLLSAWAKENSTKGMSDQPAENDGSYYIDASPNEIMEYSFESVADLQAMFLDCWNMQCEPKVKTILAVSAIGNEPEERRSHEAATDPASEMQMPDFIYMF